MKSENSIIPIKCVCNKATRIIEKTNLIKKSMVPFEANRSVQNPTATNTTPNNTAFKNIGEGTNPEITMRQNEIAAPTNKDTEPAPKWIRFLLARLEKVPCNFKSLSLERKTFESKKVLTKLITKGKNKTISESNIVQSCKILCILVAINNNNIRNALVAKKMMSYFLNGISYSNLDFSFLCLF